MRILESGQAEPLKAAVHACAMGLTIVMAVYNGAAWLQRRQSHLLWNWLIYSGASLWESVQVRHHIRHAGADGFPARASDLHRSLPDELRVA